MNCTEFHDCACEVVDRRLSDDRTKELLQHAQLCPHCRYELQALAAAKQAVHDKVPMVTVPASLYYSILDRTVHRSGHSWFSRLFGVRLNPAIAVTALLMVAVGIYSLLVPYGTVSDDADIIRQSLTNYQAVIGGAIKPQMVGESDRVRTFLEQGVAFDVNVPRMKDCSSCAGVLSDFKGVKLAHVVYQIGNDIVYIYQADMSEAMKGERIGLPEKAKDELKRTDWYIEENPDGRTVVLWKYKNTLCAAVSGMKKSELLSLLTKR